MPFAGAYDPPADPDAYSQAVEALPVDQGQRFGAIAAGASHIGAVIGHAFQEDFAGTPLSPASEDQVLGQMSSDDANQRYGVQGYLRFNAPTSEYDAAWRSSQAQRKQFQDYVLANTRPAPLSDLGASLTGALTDPGGLAIMAATDGFGEAALGALGLARGAEVAGEAGAAMARLGRLGNLARVPIEGALNQVPYVGVSAYANNAVGDEYDAADALRDIAAGAIFHTATHGLGAGARMLLGRTGAAEATDYAAAGLEPPERTPATSFTPETFVPPEGVPDEVSALTPAARMGAFVKAIDDMTDDRPVDIGQYVARDLEAGAPPVRELAPDELQPSSELAGARLDELKAEPPEPQPELQDVDPARQLLADVAQRFTRGDPGDLDVRPPGKAAEPEVAAPGADGLDLNAPDGGGAAAGREPGAERGDAGAASGRVGADHLIAADPELKALHADTQALIARHGLELETPENEDPKNLAEALRAAAVCLAKEGMQ